VSRVLVTGATGFVGRAVCARLLEEGWRVRAALRSNTAAPPAGADEVAIVGDIAQGRWESAVEGAAAVVHLAAAVHDVGARADEAFYDAVNCLATERLADAAARAGARRFVFMSSIKVNGESTSLEQPFRAGDSPRPQDAYARSKWRAEQALAGVAHKSGLEVAVIRPPLVYGAGVKANFRRLVRLVDSRLPLPFASIRNRRSLIYVANLASLVGRCLAHPQAAGRTFLASDGEDLGTPELVRRIGAALGFSPRLLPFPPALLPRRLAGSLALDAGHTRQILGWQAPFTVDEGLARSVGQHGA
jgi:nucleoside-diphosphate-sugar epimerase